jgi:hypothetical protein
MRSRPQGSKRWRKGGEVGLKNLLPPDRLTPRPMKLALHRCILAQGAFYRSGARQAQQRGLLPVLESSR